MAAAGCGDDLRITDEVTPPALREPAVPGSAAGAAARGPGTPLDTSSQPDVFAGGQTGARNLFVVGDQIDWLRDEGNQVSLVRARPAGGDAHTVAVLPGSPTELAVGGTELYWTDWSAGTVSGIPLDGGNVTQVWQNPSGPGAITAIGKAIYWGADDGCVRMIDSLGAPVRRLSCGAGVPLSIQADGKNLFWTSSSGDLFVAPIAGGAPEKLAADNSFLGPMLFDGVTLFWINGDNGLIRAMRDDVGAFGQVSDLAKEDKTPTAMVLGGLDLYFAIDGAQQIKRISKDGTGLELVAEDVYDPTDLALLDGHLYWIEDGTGTVMTLALR